jgi:DNA-binding protein HU-beta
MEPKVATIKELAEYVAANHSISRAAARSILETVTGYIRYQTVQLERPVVIEGLGKFSIKHRAARQGRNPRTGEAIAIPASRALTFKQAAAVSREITE